MHSGLETSLCEFSCCGSLLPGLASSESMQEGVSQPLFPNPEPGPLRPRCRPEECGRGALLFLMLEVWSWYLKLFRDSGQRKNSPRSLRVRAQETLCLLLVGPRGASPPPVHPGRPATLPTTFQHPLLPVSPLLPFMPAAPGSPGLPGSPRQQVPWWA